MLVTYVKHQDSDRLIVWGGWCCARQGDQRLGPLYGLWRGYTSAGFSQAPLRELPSNMT